jgi:hypothetical protein
VSDDTEQPIGEILDIKFPEKDKFSIRVCVEMSGKNWPKEEILDKMRFFMGVLGIVEVLIDTLIVLGILTTGIDSWH